MTGSLSSVRKTVSGFGRTFFSRDVFCCVSAMVRGVRVCDLLDPFFFEFDIVACFDGKGLLGLELPDG